MSSFLIVFIKCLISCVHHVCSALLCFEMFRYLYINCTSWESRPSWNLSRKHGPIMYIEPKNRMERQYKPCGIFLSSTLKYNVRKSIKVTRPSFEIPSWVLLYWLPSWVMLYCLPSWVLLYWLPSWVMLYWLPSWVMLYWLPSWVMLYCLPSWVMLYWLPSWVLLYCS